MTDAKYRYDASLDSSAKAQKQGLQTDTDEPSRHRHSTSGAPTHLRFRTGGDAFSADDRLTD